MAWGNYFSLYGTYINIYTCIGKYCILYIKVHMEIRMFVVISQHEVYILTQILPYINGCLRPCSPASVTL